LSFFPLSKFKNKIASYKKNLDFWKYLQEFVMDADATKSFKIVKSNKIKVVKKIKVIEIIYKPKLLICKAKTVRDVS